MGKVTVSWAWCSVPLRLSESVRSQLTVALYFTEAEMQALGIKGLPPAPQPESVEMSLKAMSCGSQGEELLK